MGPTRKVGSTKGQVGNVSRDMETLRKNQREMLEIKSTITERKNAFDGFISRFDTTEEGISEFEDRSTENTLIKQRKKRVSASCGQYKKV